MLQNVISNDLYNDIKDIAEEYLYNIRNKTFLILGGGWVHCPIFSMDIACWK